MANSVSESSNSYVPETAYRKYQPEKASREPVKAKANVESLPENPAVTDALREVPALKYSIKGVPDRVKNSLSESTTETVETGTKQGCGNVPGEHFHVE